MFTKEDWSAIMWRIGYIEGLADGTETEIGHQIANATDCLYSMLKPYAPTEETDNA